MRTFRHNLAALLAKRKLSQRQFAKQIRLSRPYVNQLLTGARMPTVRTLKYLSKFFNTSIDRLLRETPKKAA